jgi:hypothetical protein
MVTATVPSRASRVSAAGRYDRVFYTAIASALMMVVLAGFSSTYYGPLASGRQAQTVSGGPITPLVHAHGLLFTAWMALFVVQAVLIARRRVPAHRTLGTAGALLAVAMVLVGGAIAVRTAARGGAPPGIDPRAFLAVPLFDLVLFSGFVSTALYFRRNKEAHKRLMLLASVSIVAAAFARIAGIAMNPFVFFGLAGLFIVAGVVYDTASRGRVHPAYVWGGAVFVISVPLRLALSGTGAWLAVADWLIR